MKRLGALFLTTIALPITLAYGGETDQYLAWDKEIADSADAINAYLNEHLERYVELANVEYKKVDTEEKFARGYFFYLFNGLHSSRFKVWIKAAEEVDTFPKRGMHNLVHQRHSIYRGPAFPFILPMSRTININGVHLGIDKVMHFFGFGRRYYKNYVRYRKRGLDEEAAMEKMILRGWMIERYMVGGLTDGIVAYADLEANFQGFRLARGLCGGDAPHVALRGGTWVLLHEIDLREYITPEFDESYYRSKYQGLRRRLVEKAISESYDLENPPPAAVARFQRYAQMPESYSARFLAGIIAERGGGIPEQYARREQP